ncbi:MAG: hypothetical protein WC730_00375 [Patescibacteria group bacterium]|jgi:primosomal protein N'
MVAEVYLIRRLPRRFDFFDYAIPEGLQIGIGDLVRVSFRGHRSLGIVRSLVSTSTHRLIPLEELIESNFLSNADLIRYEKLAQLIFQSPSTILYTACMGYAARAKKASPFIQKKRISSLFSRESVRLAQSAAATTGSFFETSQEGEMIFSGLLRKKTKGQLLVLVPRERTAEMLAERIPLGPGVAVLTGHTKGTHRESIIAGWRHGDIRTLIGNRQASLLPAHDLSIVHIHDLSSREYDLIDRNPRFDVRLAGEMLAKAWKAECHASGAFPRIGREFHSFLEDPPQKPTIIDLKHQDEHGNTPGLSETLYNAIKEALQGQKTVLLSFNRKGNAKYLQCEHCKAIPSCPICEATPECTDSGMRCPQCLKSFSLPTSCPFCGKSLFFEKGIGNKVMKRRLEKAFPEIKIGIIDKDIQEPGASILLVTDYHFDSFALPFDRSWGLIADLTFDYHLNQPDYRSRELAAARLHRLMHFAGYQKTPLFIQTWMSDAVKSLVKTQTVIEEIKNTRAQYGLPPSTIEVRLAPTLLPALGQNSRYFREEQHLAKGFFTQEQFTHLSETLDQLPERGTIEILYPTYDSPGSPSSQSPAS